MIWIDRLWNHGEGENVDIGNVGYSIKICRIFVQNQDGTACLFYKPCD